MIHATPLDLLAETLFNMACEIGERAKDWFEPAAIEPKIDLVPAGPVAEAIGEFLADPSTGVVRDLPARRVKNDDVTKEDSDV